MKRKKKRRRENDEEGGGEKEEIIRKSQEEETQNVCFSKVLFLQKSKKFKMRSYCILLTLGEIWK